MLQRLLLTVLAIVFVVAGVFWLYQQRNINNITTYQECMDAGYPIMESYPPQCRTADGTTFVGPSSPQIEQNPLIQVQQPQANQTVTNPITIRGSARGPWYFEATFPIKALDDNGQVISTSYAQAEGEWMTEEFVPFTATVDLPESTRGSVTLLFERSNPSGLPQNNSSIQIPVIVE